MTIQPSLPLFSLPNTRDLGGLFTQDGRRIRPCRLIRSGALFGASPGDLEVLTGSWQVNLVVDFRTPREQQERPDPVLPGVRRQSLPIVEESALGLTQEQDRNRQFETQLLERLSATQGAAEEYMASLYRMVASSPFSRQQYARFLQLLLQQEKGAVLWHCSAGKDRVGVGTALALTALGVSRKTVMEDYLATAGLPLLRPRKGCVSCGKGEGRSRPFKACRFLWGFGSSIFRQCSRYGSRNSAPWTAFLKPRWGLGPPNGRGWVSCIWNNPPF